MTDDSRLVVDDDTALMRRVAQHDQRAEEEFLRRYWGLVNGSARRIHRPGEDPEDAAQDIWLHLLRQAPRWRRQGAGSLDAWVRRVATHKALERVRGERPPALIPMDEGQGGPEMQAPAASGDPGPQVEWREVLWEMHRCLDGVAQATRRALLLRGLGYTQQQIAALLQASPNTVATWTARGLRALRKCLEGKWPGVFTAD